MCWVISCFFGLYGFIDSTAEEGDRKQGERERGSDTQQMVPRPGVEPWSAAVRTKPLYMGRLLYQLS